MVSRGSLAASAAAIALLAAASPVRASCNDVARTPATGAALSPRDLVEITEIGFPDGSVAWPFDPVAVDPSGTRIAFQTVRADIATNRYCYSLLVQDLRTGVSRVVALGGDYVPQSAQVRSLFAIFGTPLIAAPVWSPDGRTIAWLRHQDGTTQGWIAAADGSGERRATRAPTDVEELRWSADGRLLYATRPAMAEVNASLDREGAAGWLYDDRMTPNAGARPRILAASVPVKWFAQASNGGGAEPVPAPLPAVPTNVSGERLVVTRTSDLPFADAQLNRKGHGGVVRPCAADVCRGRIVSSWWQPGSDTAWFLRREGWQHETSALYRWRAGAAPERMVATTDPINNCEPAASGVVCLTEGSSTPRRIVRIDWRDGKVATQFDPNPDFSRFRLGTVTRLKWRNARGYEAWGDLVLPPGYRKGDKVPLVVTQYTSRGFMRGGTGNEYPIFLFAARGMAVLSTEAPDDVATRTPGWTSAADGNRINALGWANRWSLHSSIEQGVKAAIATGAIDPARVGITGLSDGATEVRFALINSKTFAAAALSSCCIEPDTPGIAGPAFAKTLGFWGAPAYGAPGDDFWKPIALTLNADRIDTPLLMQLSDDEYSLALGAYEALRARGKPVEMYVFPDEHHNKSLPVHRLAIYERNLDWFAFWLMDREDSDPAKREQYARWRALRATR